jgi:hypothetical protein
MKYIMVFLLLLIGCCGNERMRVADDIERIKDIDRLVKMYEERGMQYQAFEMLRNKCYLMQKALKELNAPIADYCGCKLLSSKNIYKEK